MNIRKVISILLIGISILSAAGCEKKPLYEKYSNTFLGTFDTAVTVVGYTKTKNEFDDYEQKIYLRMVELHKLYDKYNNYEGINNIKTINDNAGIKPVKVDKEIIDLILFSKNLNEKISNKTNIAMGAVLKIWSEYRDEAELGNPKIPPIEDLLAANEHIDINKIIIDEENSTVYLDDPLMSLDVGAVAKGYATEVVIKEIIDEGFDSVIISAGGNIRAYGKPFDDIRDKWGVGIQNPDSIIGNSESNVLETIFVNDAAVVTSGDYQRFYIVDDTIIHHLIDPETLMPGDYYRAVTILADDSGEADFLSTTAFLLPYEECRDLIESLDGVEALWVFKDGTVEATDGMKKIMKSYGATGAKGAK